MIENDEVNEDEYIIGTVILAQDIKLARQRRRIAHLEAAILQLRESAVELLAELLSCVPLSAKALFVSEAVLLLASADGSSGRRPPPWVWLWLRCLSLFFPLQNPFCE